MKITVTKMWELKYEVFTKAYWDIDIQIAQKAVNKLGENCFKAYPYLLKYMYCTINGRIT
jgi:hypothetical protein